MQGLGTPSWTLNTNYGDVHEALMVGAVSKWEYKKNKESVWREFLEEQDDFKGLESVWRLLYGDTNLTS